MSLKLNGATNGSIELDVPAAIGSDLNITIPATAGEVAVKATDGSVDLGDVNIDSSGRLLVGTSSPPPANTSDVLIRGATGSGGAGGLTITRINSTPADSNSLGSLYFADSNANPASRIESQRDGGTWTSGSSQPSRLLFYTTANSASTPTERMRISSNGQVRNTAPSNTTIFYTNSQGAAGTGFSFYFARSGNDSDTEYNLRGDGTAFADGSWNGGGADYAEFFEWSDGNTATEDRRGISVVLDGDKIREAITGEEPIGVISGNPSVVGDAAWNKWTGKYLRDDFGTYIQEDYEVVNDEGETVVQQRRKLNPDYDPDQEYISREQRPEWDCVGLMGKLRIRKDQITGSRWIKMRDVSDTVEEWLVR